MCFGCLLIEANAPKISPIPNIYFLFLIQGFFFCFNKKIHMEVKCKIHIVNTIVKMKIYTDMYCISSVSSLCDASWFVFLV